MSTATRDILEALRAELAFINQAERLGLGPATLLNQGSLFRNSPICLNLGNPKPIYPCGQCSLMGFVPAERRSESLPCYHIPLNAKGETIAMIDMHNKQYRLYQVVKDWLQKVVVWLERDRAENKTVDALLLHGDHEPLSALRPLLEGLGIHTSRASSCEEVSQVLQRVNVPSLLFTEPILSDGTWLNVLELLNETRTKIAVIVVSHAVDKKLAMDFIERGGFECLVSPVTVLDLAYIVRCAVWSSRSTGCAGGNWI
jgi:ActR/RegA family two-component response regulator